MARPLRVPGPSPATRVGTGEEPQDSMRRFRRQAESERSWLCGDEGGGSDLLKLDDALASVDDFVAYKL